MTKPPPPPPPPPVAQKSEIHWGPRPLLYTTTRDKRSDADEHRQQRTSLNRQWWHRCLLHPYPDLKFRSPTTSSKVNSTFRTRANPPSSRMRGSPVNVQCTGVTESKCSSLGQNAPCVIFLLALKKKASLGLRMKEMAMAIDTHRSTAATVYYSLVPEIDRYQRIGCQ